MTSVLPSVAGGSTQIPYQEWTYTLAPGERVTVYQAFNYIRVLAASGTGLVIRLGQNGLETPYTGAGIGIRAEQTFDQAAFYNASAAPNTITVAFGIGIISDDRLNVSGTVNTQIVGPLVGNAVRVSDKQCDSFESAFATYNHQVTIGDTATQIMDASTATAWVLVGAGNEDLYISQNPSVTKSTGFLIPAGGYLEIPSGLYPALYGIRDTGITATAYRTRGRKV